MNMRLTAPYMGSTDVDPENDYAAESTGVDRESGLWVIDHQGNLITFSIEVQEQIHEALGDYLKASGKLAG